MIPKPDTKISGEIIEGIARLDRKTKNLVKRLSPGDIAIIDHKDIDRVSAELLVETLPSLVVNAASSITGTFPNVGPLIIVGSGIKILDEVGKEVFERVEEGDILRLEGENLLKGDSVVARGKLLEVEMIERIMERSKEKIGIHLEDFAINTMKFLDAEKEILLGTVDLPSITTKFAGRHTLIVVRGHDYKKDLRALKPYLREMKPVLVGVDGGADALLEIGLKPHMIVGDMDSVTDTALRCGAELVVHGYTDGHAPGKERLDKLGLPSTVFRYPGTSEDIAMIIAYEKGAELIVVVGGHTNLVEFLEKDRKGMASTFLVRLRIGEVLVDAKGVSRIYEGRLKWWHLALMVFAILLVISIVIAVSEPVRQFFSVLAMRFQVWLLKLQKLI